MNVHRHRPRNLENKCLTTTCHACPAPPPGPPCQTICTQLPLYHTGCQFAYFVPTPIPAVNIQEPLHEAPFAPCCHHRMPRHFGRFALEPILALLLHQLLPCSRTDSCLSCNNSCLALIPIFALLSYQFLPCQHMLGPSCVASSALSCHHPTVCHPACFAPVPMQALLACMTYHVRHLALGCHLCHALGRIPHRR